MHAVILSNYFRVAEEERAKKNPMYYINKTNKETESVLKELEQSYKEPVRVLIITFLLFTGALVRGGGGRGAVAGTQLMFRWGWGGGACHQAKDFQNRR